MDDTSIIIKTGRWTIRYTGTGDPRQWYVSSILDEQVELLDPNAALLPANAQLCTALDQLASISLI